MLARGKKVKNSAVEMVELLTQVSVSKSKLPTADSNGTWSYAPTAPGVSRSAVDAKVGGSTAATALLTSAAEALTWPLKTGAYSERFGSVRVDLVRNRLHDSKEPPDTTRHPCFSRT